MCSTQALVKIYNIQHLPNIFFKLIRLGEDSCLFSLVCDSLPGNTCGSYALSFKQISSEDNNNISIDVCYQGLLYEQWIRPFDQIQIDFWTLDQGNAHKKTLVGILIKNTLVGVFNGCKKSKLYLYLHFNITLEKQLVKQ